MTNEEIRNLAGDILRLVQQRGAGDGTRSMIASLIGNAQTIARRNAGTVNTADLILTESMVSGSTKAPIVTIKWGNTEGQLSPGEARDFAERLRRTADAAESDAFVFDFVNSKLGIEPDAATVVLHTFREFREERARKDYLP